MVGCFTMSSEVKRNLADWNIAKGIPGTLENIADIVYSCYNFLTSRLCRQKVHASIAWYNKEIYSCLRKVSAVLENEQYMISSIERGSCDDIMSMVQCLFSHQRMPCCLYHALVSLILCISVIWRASINDFSEANTRCFELAKSGDKIPFDCIVEDGKCIKAKLLSVSSLNAMYDESYKPSLEKDAGSLQQHLIYASASLQYHKGDYESSLDILCPYLLNIENVEDDSKVSKHNLSSMHNLVGCCYAKLGCPNISVIHFRKAVRCEECKIACHLQNAAVIYKITDKLEAALEALEIIVTLLESEHVTEEGVPVLIITHKAGIQLCKSSNISHWGWPVTSQDLNSALYLAGNASLLSGRFEKSFDYYQKLLSRLNQMLTLGVVEACVPLPPKEQILAQRQLALCKCARSVSNESVEKEFGEMNTKVRCLSEKLYCILHDSGSEQNSSVLDDFIRTSVQLYHCFCTVLCFTKQIVHSAEEVSIITLGYEQLNFWAPKFYDIAEVNWVDAAEDQINSAKKIAERLNVIQGKLLLNKAIMMLCTENTTEILGVIRRALMYTPQDIEVRWKLVLLLWKLGHKSEACEMWLRTRGIDHNLGNKEMKAMVEEKQAANVSEQTKTLYHKDIVILKELYHGRNLGTCSS